MPSASRHCCQRCGMILAQREAAGLVPRVPVVLITAVKIRLECSGCKRLVWLGLPKERSAA